MVCIWYKGSYLSVVAGNVLLHSSEESAHGFQAKISDFGMARDIGTMTKLETRTYGTITHMAPEVLANDYISKVWRILSRLQCLIIWSYQLKCSSQSLHAQDSDTTLHCYARCFKHTQRCFSSPYVCAGL